MKKAISGLIGLVLLSGCAGKPMIPDNAKLYQMQKQETIITDEYVIQKGESITIQKIEKYKLVH